MSLHLITSAAVPSFTHSYSIITEFATRWFLSKFTDDYFKTIHIEGKHVLDDFRTFDFHNLIKKGKPALAILPTISFDYDRDGLDTSMYGLDHLMSRKDTFTNSFVRNIEKGTFISLQMEEMEVKYRYKIRVESRSQQLDLYRWMRVAFRIGHNETKIINADYHVPYGMVLQFAKDNGFALNGNVIVDIKNFLKFVNSKSELPFIMKLRTVSGNSEFFIRVPNVNILIDNRTQLSLDDGESQGRLDNNFHIEMEVTMKMPSPMLYFYYSPEPHELITTTPENGSDTIIYNIETITITDIPEINNKGWLQELKTEYQVDEADLAEPVSIELKGLFDMINCTSIIEHNNSINLSSDNFLEFVVYSQNSVVPHTMDWKNMKLTLNQLVKSTNMLIVVYMDGNYVVEQMKIIDKIEQTRLD